MRMIKTIWKSSCTLQVEVTAVLRSQALISQYVLVAGAAGALPAMLVATTEMFQLQCLLACRRIAALHCTPPTGAPRAWLMAAISEPSCRAGR